MKNTLKTDQKSEKYVKYTWIALGLLLAAWGIWNQSQACYANGFDTSVNLTPAVLGYAILFWQAVRAAKSTLTKILAVVAVLILVALGLVLVFALNFGKCFTF